MNGSNLRKLEGLRSDYQSVVGVPFETFYCPILFRDEHVELCRAHLVNQAFVGASRRWTIQRKDLDGFFGAFFESDFVKLQPRGRPDEDPFAILADKHRAQLRPSVYLDGEKIEHYLASGEVPAQHSKFAVDFGGQAVSLGLKLHPDKTLSAADQNWEVRIDADFRVGSCVSLLKAAHLGLFELLGYRYALSAGGHFMGFNVPGEFFLANRGLNRGEVLSNAVEHFEEFANMVRPVGGGGDDLKGTAEDRLLYLCTRGTELRWAFLVLIRTGETVHAVLVPIFEDPIAIDVFLKFLKNSDDQIDAALTKYDGERWHVAQESKKFRWPKPATFS